ncbi:MAG TPA: ferredoxin [Acidimicrobiales bacterium]|nr:ferredoxin [Acidimicrobiales bacterium]
MALKVSVQRARCIGTGACVRAAGRTFALDDAQIAMVLEPPRNPEHEVIEAAEACPTGAISVFRDGARIA